ncbi:iron-sulfur cluster assembly protein IscA [Aurantivibrio infirmus]
MTVSTFDPSAPIDSTTPAVSITEAALRHFEKKLAQEQAKGTQKKMLRLSTAASGCSGYAYVLDMVDAPESGDELIQSNDVVTLAIDEKAVSILRGTEIDLVVEGVNRVVKFHNPNVVAECGCGESFTVS